MIFFFVRNTHLLEIKKERAGEGGNEPKPNPVKFPVNVPRK